MYQNNASVLQGTIDPRRRARHTQALPCKMIAAVLSLILFFIDAGEGQPGAQTGFTAKCTVDTNGNPEIQVSPGVGLEDIGWKRCVPQVISATCPRAQKVLSGSDPMVVPELWNVPNTSSHKSNSVFGVRWL